MYDAQIGRWHVPDPLNEHEYKYAIDKEITEELCKESIQEDDEETISEARNSTEDFLRILGPSN
jgi:hypothetical protein